MHPLHVLPFLKWIGLPQAAIFVLAYVLNGGWDASFLESFYAVLGLEVAAYGIAAVLVSRKPITPPESH